MSEETKPPDESVSGQDGEPSSSCNALLSDRLMGYIHRALSKDNRKTWDGDSNAPYRVVIEFAEVGSCRDEPAGFCCEVKIPRQVDNELGLTVREFVCCRDDAATVLRSLVDILDAG